MAGNSIGKALVFTSFGESHGPATGGIIDGFPSLITIDKNFILAEITRRNPAGYPFSTGRTEADDIEFLSGLSGNITTGTPIAFLIRNHAQQPGDYDHLKELYRPSHADFTYEQKYGIRDYRGGGRSSARATAAWVAAGAMAKILLARHDIRVWGFVSQIGPFRLNADTSVTLEEATIASPLSWPDQSVTEEMLKFLEETRAAGDTAGGVITCIISGAPAGLGEPLFDKLHADLAKAVLSIPSVKGFEVGSGFAAAAMTGSRHNDPFIATDGRIRTATNHSGGIQGGISNGMDILFRAAFKPVSTLAMSQHTVDRDGRPVTFEGKGRHDICVVPRAVPIVEAMAALTIADHLLRSRCGKE